MCFRKIDHTWVRVQGTQWARAFGSTVAVAEAQTKDGQHRESAGRGSWRNARSANGPHIRGKLEEAKVVYSGRLLLVDTATGKFRTIATGQGDSEVLLVEGPDVYYRVNNRLYHATLTVDGVSASRLLTEADVITDVHWAFMKR